MRDNVRAKKLAAFDLRPTRFRWTRNNKKSMVRDGENWCGLMVYLGHGAGDLGLAEGCLGARKLAAVLPRSQSVRLQVAHERRT